LASVSLIEDRTARFLSQTVAATLYGDAGQYDLALRYINQALEYDHGDRSTCIALTQKMATLARSGELRVDEADGKAGHDACTRISDVLYANIIRAYQAQALSGAGRNRDALALLQAHDAEMLSTRSAAATSLYRALLARCFMLAGDFDKAQEYAT